MKRGREIDKILEKGESNRIEFKESPNLKNEIGENVSAFSNTNGGRILIGIGDNGEVKGINLGKDTIERLANFIKQNTDNSIYANIYSEKKDNKTILVIEISQANEKPVFFKNVAYKRVGKSCHKINSSELRNMAKTSSKVYWDKQKCNNCTLSDIDKKRVEEYLKQRERNRNISKNMDISINVFMKNINAVSEKVPTNAGILFFGKRPLTKLPQAQLRISMIKGKDVTGFILDRVDCRGTIPEMIGQAEEFLRKNIKLMGIRGSKSFKREDRFVIPIDALRELIVNSVIHRDYETSSDVRVFIFDDRIEIINPGKFPKGVTPKKPKHKPVNPLLSSYMYDIGYVEKYGSGILKVRRLLKENGNKGQDYSFNELETITKVYMENKLEVQANSEVGEKVGEKVGKNEKKILNLISQESRITYVGLADALNIAEKNVYKNIEKLKQKGMLKRVGSAKGGHWEVLNE